MTAPPVITFCDVQGLKEGLRALKDYLQLSNATVESCCNFAGGWYNKTVGPTGYKMMPEDTLDALLWLFAAKCTMTIDLEKMKQLEEYWEQRNTSQYRPEPNRISEKLVQRATPAVRKASAKHANAARNAVLTREHRSALARKAARVRWRRHREAQRLARCVAD